MAGFDYFRSRRAGFVPRTPAAALKAIVGAGLPPEHFIHVSTSAKPLDEEPFDFEAIERVLSRTDLTLETEILLKGVLEKLIAGADQETGLFGAEGINALEARHVERIKELKSKKAGPRRRQAIAQTYYEMAQLHGREDAVRAFYLREAFRSLQGAHRPGRTSRTDLRLAVDILVALGLHAHAARQLSRVRAQGDPLVLLLSARIAYHRGAYARVADLCRRLLATAGEMDAEERAAVEFWAGGGASD